MAAPRRDDTKGEAIVARTPARSVAEFEVKFENSYTQFQLGFEQGSNPRAWSRLLALSLLNAGRTMVKPMKQEAPVRTGRLRNSINAKRGMYQRPSVTVGPRPGQSRGDLKGAWYRWFVTSGTKPSRETKSGIKAVRGVAARPFVVKTATRTDVYKKALDVYWSTIDKYFTDKVFKDRITKFRKTR